MSNISLKRLMRDYKNISTDLLAKKGIYTKINDENIYEAYALIIGPKDTPYNSGFYFFKFNFCKKYPLVPPKVTFMTLNAKVRFNPNLYVEGKVCLSILGTWSGPSWTSCMNFETILVSLQSLLNDKPIQNEPGFEKENGTLMETYNILLKYYNIKIAVLDMLNNPPADFEYFVPIMKKEFYKRYNEYVDDITRSLLPITDNMVHLKMYSMCQMIRSNSLLNELEKYHQLHLNETTEITTTEEIIVNKIKRKCPKESATGFDIGTIKTGLNDKDWVVKEIKSGKRWFKN